MAGYDKFILKEKLVSLGWIDIAGEDEGCYKMVPPDSLWENKPPYFSIYDARDLQIDLESPANNEMNKDQQPHA